MRRSAVIPIFLAIGITLSQPLAISPAFEVASVKPADPQQRVIGLSTFPGGRITVTRFTLEMLIEEAFEVQGFQISGGPSWINNDRYDIVAKPPTSSPSSKANPPYPKAPPNAEQRLMLQILLVDRFGLKYHRGTKDAPVYLLVRGNKELKLQDSKNKDEFPWAGGLGAGVPSGNGLRGENESMADFAKRLSRWLGHPVLDQTGLTGSYDFKIEYQPDDSHPDVVASILASVQGLGLKLEVTKRPIETIVIDAAEKPSGN